MEFSAHGTISSPMTKGARPNDETDSESDSEDESGTDLDDDKEYLKNIDGMEDQGKFLWNEICYQWF